MVISNLVRDGVSGLVVCGSVGENTSLTIEEKMAVTEVAKDASGGRVPVICGIAEFTSAGAAKVAKAVERVGVDGIMVMPALVYSSKPHETAEHFRSVASGTDLPVMVYNNPPIYRNDVTPDILVSLADCENIVCFKDSSGDTRRFIDVRNQVGERFILFAGLDDVVLESVAVGAQGWISGMSNVFPKEGETIFRLARAGRFAEAMPIYEWLMPILHLDARPDLVQCIKLCEELADRGSALTRPPRLALRGADREHVERIMAKALASRPALPDVGFSRRRAPPPRSPGSGRRASGRAFRPPSPGRPHAQHPRSLRRRARAPQPHPAQPRRRQRRSAALRLRPGHRGGGRRRRPRRRTRLSTLPATVRHAPRRIPRGDRLAPRRPGRRLRRPGPSRDRAARRTHPGRTDTYRQPVAAVRRSPAAWRLPRRAHRSRTTRAYPPRPDLRQWRIGLGPVAVFGASNFPLAFSTAGGDSAAALAAGCPVVVKAHGGHMATAECVADAILQAAADSGMPAGVFNMVYGNGVGEALVRHPAIRAVGFTGSLKGGRALCDLAAARPQPIPVFAEMSSINPLVVLPEPRRRGRQVAEELADSVTLGCGQFCTAGPGAWPALPGFDAFVAALGEALAARPAQSMLNAGTLRSYVEGLQRLERHPGIRRLAGAPQEGRQAHPQLFKADVGLLLEGDELLQEEVFGPATVVVEAADEEQLARALDNLHGQLTATLIGEADDLAAFAGLVPQLEGKAGRLLFNGYPTGVEVCDAMVHGGPYPATSDARGTSVGTLAIERFLRPLCYQDYPDSLLPDALKNANPLGLLRLVDGRSTRKALD